MSDSTISTESDLEPREVFTESDLTEDGALPEIVIREVLTIDEIIKERGFINIFEENFVGYLQGLLKNRSKAEIFNGLYERYRVAQNLARPEEECYMPILANVRDTIENRESQISEDEQVDKNILTADEFTRLYIDYRRKLAQRPVPELNDYLQNPFALALLNATTDDAVYTQPPERERQEVCVGGDIDDTMVLRHEKAGIELRRIGTAYREMATTPNMNMANRQWRTQGVASAEIPSFENTLAEITPEMEIHEIIVLLEKRGYPLFYLTADQFDQLKERLTNAEAELELESPPDYGAATAVASAAANTHENRIKEYWDILRQAVDSVSSRIRNRPTIDAPEKFPDPPDVDYSAESPESLIQIFKTYKAESYKKIINDIYEDYRNTAVNVERTSSKIAWDKYIEPWIKYVYSYEFQFIKLYNELEEIRVAEDTQNYLGSIYDLDGIVQDAIAAEAVDAVDDDVGDEDPFRELEYEEEQEPAAAEAAEAAEAPPPEPDSAMRVELITEDLYRPGTLANDIIDAVKTFLQYWIYNTGLLRYFDPQILKAALRDFYNKDSRVQKLQSKLGDTARNYNYASYIANNILERPIGVDNNTWNKVLEYLKEVDQYVVESCEAYLVEVAYRWANRMLDMLTERVIFPEIPISATLRTYWDPYGYPIKKVDLAVALLKPGLLKYLGVVAQETIKDNRFIKFFTRSIKSLQSLEEANDNKYHMYFSKFEYRLFTREYKDREIDESKKVNPYMSQCKGDKLAALYYRQYSNNNNSLYNIKLTPDVAAEYVKVYRCLASAVIYKNEEKEGEYNNYMKTFYHKGHLILKIGSKFIPDLDWISRIANVKDMYALYLLLIKNKIKFNRLAYIPRYPLAIYKKDLKTEEGSEEPSPSAKVPPIEIVPPLETIATDLDIDQTLIENLYEHYNKIIKKYSDQSFESMWIGSTNNYVYYRTLSKRLMKTAYSLKAQFPPTHEFYKNLDMLIKMHRESPESAKIYRDICILTIYINNWTTQLSPNQKLLSESIDFYNEWNKIPNTYVAVNNIITEQREINKNKQLAELNLMGQEKANLQKELISVGFKK